MSELSNTPKLRIMFGVDQRISLPFLRDGDWTVTVKDGDLVNVHRFGGNIIEAGKFYNNHPFTTGGEK